MSGMMKESGPTACGVWCFGMSCGCSYSRGCLTSDDDVESVSAKFTFGEYVESSSGGGGGDVYTGNKHPPVNGKTSAQPVKSNGKTPDNDVQVISTEFGIKNNGFDIDKDDVSLHMTKATLSSSSCTPSISAKATTTPTTTTTSEEPSQVSLSDRDSKIVSSSERESPPDSTTTSVTIKTADVTLKEDENEC